MLIKKLKATALAGLVAAGAVASSAPAHAAAKLCDLDGKGSMYICDYGMTQRHFPGGVEQFIIGSDRAVWTRWLYEGEGSYFGGWTSLGGVSQSEVYLTGEWDDDGHFSTHLTIVGTDGKPWQRIRPDIGANWTGWDHGVN